jgi:hypothetical protein
VFIFQFGVFYLLNYSLVWFAIIKSVVCCIKGVVLNIYCIVILSPKLCKQWLLKISLILRESLYLMELITERRDVTYLIF